MKELDIPEEFINALGIKELNPVQKEAVKKGLFEKKNMVIASPTASGKTLVAELAMIKHFLDGGKTIYLVPLKALASEKYKEFKKKYSDLGLKAAISIGDYDSSGGWLGKYDVIICTNEKMDSLIRHDVSWISKTSLIIIDEIHLLNDYGRGPIIEFALTQLRRLANSQLIALSATISNADEIAKWLDAVLVKKDYRPVKLFRGVLYQSNTSDDLFEYTIDFLDKKNKKILGKDGEGALCKDVLEMEKQSLVFLATRRSAEAVAEKLAKITDNYLTAKERSVLNKIANDIENALPSPTKQCRKLASIVRKGSAFHHAGLIARQRELIEDNFRLGLIKLLSSTVTLAYGINIPAYRVVIRDVKRFTGQGSDYISVLDVHQMCGRSGRPAYDDAGEAVIIARNDTEAEHLKERYFLSETEPIESRLDSLPILRMYTLVLIASEACRSRSGLYDFFKKTFYCHQNDFSGIEKHLDKILKQLEDYKFIEISGNNVFTNNEFVPAFEINKDPEIRATIIGKRISELYIDPLSGWEMIKNLRELDNTGYIMAINRCSEMSPGIRVKREEYEDLGIMLENSGLKDRPEQWDVDYPDYVARFKLCLLFMDWMDEKGEDKLLDKYEIPPGELYNKLKNAEWMLYAFRELAVAMEKKEIAGMINKLMLRLKHGVREELLKLVFIKNIGRARARKLWNNKIRSTVDIKKVRLEILAEILGPQLAKKIKEEIMNDKQLDR
ncbi:MAG: DEAD/DEAH box helicase [Candidatus Aenigmarchaeota archaeon]|nr:DEAD/DEAH box helicase [Candidatus Aenigmarchaeota archaeon]